MWSKKLSELSIHFCPKSIGEDKAFPNHTDSDIFENGFITGIEIATKAIIGEFSETTQSWIANKIKSRYKIE